MRWGRYLHARRVWIAAIILVIAGLGFYLRVTMVADAEVVGPLRADASEYYLSAYNLTKNGVYTMSDARLKDPNPGAVLLPIGGPSLAVLQPRSMRGHDTRGQSRLAFDRRN